MARKTDTELSKRPNKEVKDKKTNKGVFARLGAFFRDMRSELKLVIWPDKDKLKQSAGIVFAIIIACALLIFVVDTILSQSLAAAGFYNAKPRVVTSADAGEMPTPAVTPEAPSENG